ncbi:Sarcosine oxidase gamma subunit [Roseibacterium elongatum DSM 19469]|uniref:Sarcosine oxidase gamma subunit n=1 Tax=Roseicyclus elongatus DSM 19469 TaxID=1294273 RepID=W8RSP7_9RHOB|nr:sarcosine oxidase subunit gamma [Roseibacterium elongatum]AHM04158.1 Sarcosine oxidase gamma subunit [Roseibacterium elongatum DSM 19469]
MADIPLPPRSAAAGLLPETAGNVTLSEAAQARIWAILPFSGQVPKLSDAMLAAHGVRFPSPGTLAQAGDLRAVWSGLDQCFLFGVPDQSLAAHAALVDQSDSWAHMILEGGDARAVLARLVPVDLSDAALPQGRVIRSGLGHMQALILRAAPDRFEILVFRSMAGTAVHEITRAMRTVAARAAL